MIISYDGRGGGGGGGSAFLTATINVGRAQQNNEQYLLASCVLFCCGAIALALVLQTR